MSIDAHTMNCQNCLGVSPRIICVTTSMTQHSALPLKIEDYLNFLKCILSRSANCHVALKMISIILQGGSEYKYIYMQIEKLKLKLPLFINLLN